MAPSSLKRYRCRYCGLCFNAWLPWAKAPNGVLLSGHLSQHPDQIGPYLHSGASAGLWCGLQPGSARGRTG
jgi:hypothetical protein